MEIPGPPCPDGLYQVHESDVNPSSLFPNTLELETEALLGTIGFCIRGSISCGNDGSNYTAGYDEFLFPSFVNGNTDFALEWEEPADLDFYLFKDQETLISYEDGMATSETGSTSLIAGYYYTIKVYCWSGWVGGGLGGNYVMWARWD
jgi:hypothetical protein